MTLKDARLAIDELIRVHNEECDEDPQKDLWNIAYHDGLLAAWAAVNGKPNPL